MISVINWIYNSYLILSYNLKRNENIPVSLFVIIYENVCGVSWRLTNHCITLDMKPNMNVC